MPSLYQRCCFSANQQICNNEKGCLRDGSSPLFGNYLLGSPFDLTGAGRFVTLWDMLNFPASEFIDIGVALAFISETAEAAAHSAPDSHFEYSPARDTCMKLHHFLRILDCESSCDAVSRFDSFLKGAWTRETIKCRADELCDQIRDDLKRHAFLNIPPHRSMYAEMRLEIFMGEPFVQRFKRACQDIREGMNCYAAGFYTACGYHLSRATEVAVKAFGKAIGCENPKTWEDVFRFYQKQRELEAKKRPEIWLTHGDFLRGINLTLQSVQHARNELMHDDAFYNEDDATFIITNLPEFMRKVSKTINQDGDFC